MTGVELKHQSSTDSMLGLVEKEKGGYGTSGPGSAPEEEEEIGEKPISLKDRCWETFYNYFPLCYITFGGPAAHLGIFHEKFVVKKKWLDDAMFAELLAISSGLPGPASTQMAFTIATIRDGVLPGIIAFFCWSVQGGVVMGVLGGVVANNGGEDLPRGVKFFENGLAAVAVALVAVAAYNLGNKLLKDTMTKLIATVSFILTICWPGIHWMIPFCMVCGCLASTAEHYYEKWKREKTGPKPAAVSSASGHSNSNNGARSTTDTTTLVEEGKGGSSNGKKAGRGGMLKGGDSAQDMYFTYTVKTGFCILLVWALLFIAAIVIKNQAHNRYADILATFYFAGSIIFGGGPVVIPLLYNYVVDPGWMSDSEFLLGLAIINAMPGPNFNFAAYCGAASVAKAGGGPAALGGFLAWVGIFLPGLLIKAGVLPIWREYRGLPAMAVAFRGANAAAIGLVFTATYLLIEKALSISANGQQLGPLPLLSSTLYTSLGAAAFVFVGLLKKPAPLAVMLGGGVGLLNWAYEAR